MSVDLAQVLVVEDEFAHVEAITRAFARVFPATRIRCAGNLEEYRRAAASGPPDVVLMDLNLPDGRAIDVLSDPAFPILIMTAHGDETRAVEALKAGALDYIVKSPETFAAMPQAAARALREWGLRQERESMAVALRETGERLTAVMDSIPSLIYVADPHTFEILFINAYGRKVWGNIAGKTCWQSLQEGQSGPCPFCTNSRLFPAAGEPGESLVWEVRNTRNGRWYECRDQAIRWSDGRWVRMEIATDITERKVAEEELRKLSLAVEQSPAAVLITDPAGTVEYVNPKFTRITGYTLEEAQARTSSLLKSEGMSEEAYRGLLDRLSSGEEWHGEIRSRRKNGSRYWELASISPVVGSDGAITHYVAVKEDISDRKDYEAQLEYLSTHDELTGLANRALLSDRLEQSIHYAQRSERQVAVLLLDLDRFKFINDSLGHDFGDRLLCEVARRLQDSVREADTVARLGGDEFVLLLTELAGTKDAGLVANKILCRLAEPYHLDGREITLTASLGISLYPRDGLDVATLIRNADTAMYQSKRESSTFSYYATEMNQKVLATLEMEGGLRNALERQEFRLHYQPQVDLASGRVIGCEALLRWLHPQKGMISPGDFIPLAEETGLITPIGTWALHEACRQAVVWQEAGFPELRMAVNLSARQFRKGDLPQQVRKALHQTGLAADRLELELTESMVMEDPVGAKQTMQGLKDLGVFLSLDDFGTGYSSLNYLRRFPVDSLKIDRSFIRDVVVDPSGASVVTSIVDIAHNLRLAAVAEGVETREQLDFLVGCGCDSYQGFFFSKPIPADDFTSLLRGQ
ncbi:MAG: EAL domain-containing protein [Trichloromonas sp.]|jgi:diguanylate cyclase (GGDEF)-like protein/PAS domain S-box-containing protein|nr:EAL domain-containing protein [Trichloromonas sp.]